MTKWFTVATEGQTTDGRVIQRAWLEQIAATYAPKTYGARIWMEHIRGTLADSPFKAYGDVLAVRTQDGADGKLLLQAAIDPTQDLIAMTKARQKIYTSIELSEDFAGSGKAYLIGLAVTDSPASLGTDVLAFAAKNPAAHPFASRKHQPDNLFTSALETAFDFSEVAEEEKVSGVLAKLTEMFKSAINARPSGQPALTGQQFADMAQAFEAFTAAHAAEREQSAKTITTLSQQLEALTKSTVTAKEFNELRDLLDITPKTGKQRPEATGTNGDERTDC